MSSNNFLILLVLSHCSRKYKQLYRLTVSACLHLASQLPQQDHAVCGNSESNQFCSTAYGKTRHAKLDVGLKMWLVRDNERDGRQLKRRKVTI